MEKKEFDGQLLEIVQKTKNDKSINMESHLIFDGILSSLEILQLISEIENTFSISIPITDILPENFDQISALGSMIERLKGN